MKLSPTFDKYLGGDGHVFTSRVQQYSQGSNFPRLKNKEFGLKLFVLPFVSYRHITHLTVLWYHNIRHSSTYVQGVSSLISTVHQPTEHYE